MDINFSRGFLDISEAKIKKHKDGGNALIVEGIYSNTTKKQFILKKNLMIQGCVLQIRSLRISQILISIVKGKLSFILVIVRLGRLKMGLNVL